MNEKAALVIPAYNEVPDYYKESALDQVLIAAREAKKKGLIYSYLVVDDGSRDFTYIRARSYGADVIVSKDWLGRERNMGKMLAAKAGIEYHLRQGAEIIALCDADMANITEEHIGRLLQKIDGKPCLDMVVATYKQGCEYCPDELSGVRAIRKEALIPWLMPTHKDYDNWSLFFSIFENCYAQGRKNNKNLGYCLEIALEFLIQSKKYIGDIGLVSRDRGKGEFTIDQISEGVEWGLHVLGSIFSPAEKAPYLEKYYKRQISFNTKKT